MNVNSAKLVFRKQNPNDFIKFHNYIHYCEAIIYEDGKITYAVPSHLMCLEKITGLSKEELNKLSIYDYFGDLLKITKCVSVWYDGYRFSKEVGLTKAQEETLSLLIKNKIIKDNKEF